MTISELKRGRIDHALYLSIPYPRRNVWSFPAQRTDGTLDGRGAIPEGARFRLDPELDLRSLDLPPVTMAMARAAKRYGIIVNNGSRCVAFRAEDPTPTGRNPYPRLFEGKTPRKLLASFPWGRLQLLKMDLRRAPAR